MLFLPEIPRRNVTAKIDSDNESNVINYMTALFAVCATWSSEFHFASVMSAFGTSAFTMWCATSNFMTAVKQGSFCSTEGEMDTIAIPKKITLTQLRLKYNELVDLISAINTIWSGLCCWLILEECLEMSATWNRIITSTNNFQIIYNIFVMLYTCAALVLSSECSRKVSLHNKHNRR